MEEDQNHIFCFRKHGNWTHKKGKSLVLDFSITIAIVIHIMLVAPDAHLDVHQGLHPNFVLKPRGCLHPYNKVE